MEEALKSYEKHLVSQIRMREALSYRSYQEQQKLDHLKAQLYLLRNNPDEFLKFVEAQNKPKPKSSLPECLQDPQFNHVSGRVYSMNDSCFLWLLIFWGICFLISLPFILSM